MCLTVSYGKSPSLLPSPLARLSLRPFPPRSGSLCPPRGRPLSQGPGAMRGVSCSTHSLSPTCFHRSRAVTETTAFSVAPFAPSHPLALSRCAVSGWDRDVLKGKGKRRVTRLTEQSCDGDGGIWGCRCNSGQRIHEWAPQMMVGILPLLLFRLLFFLDKFGVAMRTKRSSGQPYWRRTSMHSWLEACRA